MSHNVILNISDNVYAQLIQTLSSFSKDDVEILSDEFLETTDKYDTEYYMKHIPPELLVNSENEIDSRIAKAEKNIKNNAGMTEEESEAYLLKLCPWLENDDNQR